MPNVQPSYLTAIPAAVVGLVANQEPIREISRELQTATMAFGRVVVRGTADHQCQDGSAGVLYLGIARINPAVRADESNAYAQYDSVSIVTKGVIWVTTALTVTAGQQAYFAADGSISNSASSTTIMPNVFFDTAGTGLVKLRLN